jgi:hypothetical protein
MSKVLDVQNAGSEKKADADNNEIKIKFGVLTSHLHKRPKLSTLLKAIVLEF